MDWYKQGSAASYPQEAAQSSWQEEVTQGPQSFQRRITTIQGPEPGTLQEYEQVVVSTREHVQRGPPESDSPKAGKDPSLWASESAFSQEVQVRVSGGGAPRLFFYVFALYLVWRYVCARAHDVAVGIMCVEVRRQRFGGLIPFFPPLHGFWRSRLKSPHTVTC